MTIEKWQHIKCDRKYVSLPVQNGLRYRVYCNYGRWTAQLVRHPAIETFGLVVASVGTFFTPREAMMACQTHAAKKATANSPEQSEDESAEFFQRIARQLVARHGSQYKAADAAYLNREFVKHLINSTINNPRFDNSIRLLGAYSRDVKHIPGAQELVAYLEEAGYLNS